MTETTQPIALLPEELLLKAVHDVRAAPRIILFHGITGSPLELHDLAGFLHDKNFHVFVPRLSGHENGIRSLKLTPASAWLADVKRAKSIIDQVSDGPLYVAGLSFGAVLALRAATLSPSEFSALIMMSAPIRLKSTFMEIFLSGLSHLPDSILNCLGSRPKTPRPYAKFIRERSALDAHSIAAVARVIQIRRTALRDAYKVKAPVLLLQDPDDHHISRRSLEVLTAALKNTTVRSRWFKGGLHELSIGPRYVEVFDEIAAFLRSN